MKFPVSMLRGFVETSLDAVQLGDLLTMAGFELEGIDEVEGEAILDIKVVSNRGDGLSVFGLAREVLAKDADARPTDLYNKAASRFPLPDTTQPNNQTSVQIETEACTRYACRLFTGVKNGASPEWLQQRIRQAGMRPISLLVDLTNYVMLEVGQPMHAFDFNKLRGKRIVVKEAKPGEKLTTLDGNEHELQAGQMMICDAEGPVAVAGVMGGLDTEVDESTSDVLLESAHFVNTSVRRTRKQLGLSTEASYRFERSVDPEGVVAALNRFAQLLTEANGGQVVPGVVDEYPQRPKPVQLQVRMSRTNRLLGMEIPTEDARGYLQRLGFQVEGSGEPFNVTAPTWRADIQREDDVVEEIGRVHGYDKIPEVPLQGTTVQGGVGIFEDRIDRFREALVRAGYVQTISHSLRGLHSLDLPSDNRVGPRNAGSPEMAYLRNSHLASLADNALRNGAQNLHLFEIAPAFDGKKGEWQSAAIWSQGELVPAHRSKEKWPVADFYSVKGSLEDAASYAGACLEFTPAADPDARLHPTRQATAKSKGSEVGTVGQIHPDAAEELGVPADTVLAELNLTALLSQDAEPFSWKPISRNPAVRRDLAILISKDVPYAQIEGAVAKAGADVLEKQWLFDVYEGQGIPEGHHSLAIALQLRKPGQNFTDEEANQVRDRVAQALESLGAKQR